MQCVKMFLVDWTQLFSVNNGQVCDVKMFEKVNIYKFNNSTQVFPLIHTTIGIIRTQLSKVQYYTV